MFDILLGLVAIGLSTATAGYAYLRLRPAINSLRPEISRAGGMFDELSQLFETTLGWRNDERRLTQSMEWQRRLIAEETARVDAVGRRLSEAEARSDAISARIDGVRDEVAAVRANFSAQCKTAEGAAGKVAEGLAAATDRLDALDVAIEKLRRDVEFLPGANLQRALTHARLLSDGAVETLLHDVCPKLALELSARHLHQIAHRICSIEDLCHGRLATSVDAMTTRIVAALHLVRKPDAPFRMAEIGTLYGIGAIAIYDQVRFRARQPHMTIIDPLEGYYGAGAIDYVSTVPVTPDVLAANLAVFAVPDDAVTVVAALSESDEALSATRNEEYDLLIIDGDHSREGVERDFENYFGRVRPGGLVIVDDYGVKEWPAIKQYADQKLLPRADVQHVFDGHRTLLLRKV